MSGAPDSRQHGRYPGHQHTASGQSVHSHTFSSASLPSLSSSTGFSIASHQDPPPPPGMYAPGSLTSNPEYGSATPHMFPPDIKPMLSAAGGPTQHHTTIPPGIGLGMGGIGMPPTPLSGTVPPAFFGRSPIGPPSVMMPVSRVLHPQFSSTLELCSVTIPVLDSEGCIVH